MQVDVPVSCGQSARGAFAPSGQDHRPASLQNSFKV